MTHKYKVQPQDKQAALSGKVENDFNKIGNEKPTQKNQGERTAQSRGDRDDHIGGNNQVKTRKGSPQGDNRGVNRVRK